MLLLDACHSGAAGTSFYATNDNVADELLAGIPANFVVVSAAKGPEFSFESDGVGAFSRAFADVVDEDRAAHDLNGNGAIEISKPFLGVKRKVVEGGKQSCADYADELELSDVPTQTSWIARNQMVGDFALF